MTWSDTLYDLVAPPLCSATGKVRHTCRAEAKRHAKKMKARFGRRLWPYRCPHCGGYHTTKTMPRFRRIMVS